MAEIKYPFEPPEEDLVRSGTTENGIRYYIYDTYCKDFGPEQKEQTDRRILDIFIRSQQKKLLKERMRP